MRKMSIASALLLVGAMSLNTVAFASSPEELTAAQLEKVKEEVMSQLDEVYSELYDVDYLDWEIKVMDKAEDSVKVDVFVEADVTLVTEATEMPFYKGLQQAYEEASTAAEAAAAQQLMEAYVEEVNSLYYNIPDRTGFYLSAEVATGGIAARSVASSSDVVSELSYESVDGTFEVNDLVLDNDAAMRNGKEAVSSLLKTAAQANFVPFTTARASTYNRLGARDYALYNFYDPVHYHQYSSNCANFVSYCLNKGGGLPQTNTWKPGSYNWIRTGFNKVDGVCIYLNYYENFAWTANRSIVAAGAVVFWNAYSHVGLTTYGDGSTIRFSAHTTDRQNITLPTSENVSFYQR